MIDDAHTICVKWATPAEELAGIVALVCSLVKHRTVRPDRICLAVANRNWAAQAKRACTNAGLQATVCIAPARLTAAEHRALAELDVLAHFEDTGTEDAKKHGALPPEDACRLIGVSGGSRGFTLMHALGMDSLPAFEHALLHIRGDESARTLQNILKAQLASPTLPEQTPAVPIMHYRSLTGCFDWVFLIGCVAGLIPSPAAFEAKSEQDRKNAIDTSRQAFFAAVNTATERTVISCFTRIDAEVARQAHLRITRCKTERGTTVAMTAPTPFLQETGSNRPATMGGQTLLRTYNLN